MLKKANQSYFIFYILLCLGSISAFLLLPNLLEIGTVLSDNDILYCVLLDKFHIYCPGCGGTRGISSIVNGNFIDSILYNPISLFLLVLYMVFFIDLTRKLLSPKHKKWFNYWPALYIIILLIVYTFIIRNLLAIHFNIDYIGDVAHYWNSLK